MNMLFLFGKIFAGLLVVLAVLKVLDVIASAILVHKRDELRREKSRKERIEKTLETLESIRKSRKTWTVSNDSGTYPLTDAGITVMETVEHPSGYYENLQAAIDLQKSIAHLLPQKIENSYNLDIFLREVFDKVLAQGWFYVNFKDEPFYSVGGRTYITYKNDCGSTSQLVEVIKIEPPKATNLHKIFFEPVQ